MSPIIQHITTFVICLLVCVFLNDAMGNVHFILSFENCNYLEGGIFFTLCDRNIEASVATNNFGGINLRPVICS